MQSTTRCFRARGPTEQPLAGHEPAILDCTTRPSAAHESEILDSVIPHSKAERSVIPSAAGDSATVGFAVADLISMIGTSTATISSSVVASVAASDLDGVEVGDGVGDWAGAAGGIHGGGDRVGLGGLLPITATHIIPGTFILPRQYRRNMVATRTTRSRQTPLRIQTRIKFTTGRARIRPIRKAHPIRIHRRLMSRSPRRPFSSI